VFVRQFSVMIDAGLPLVQCLEILGTQQDNKTFAKILQQTRMDVEGGASLADAMRKHPKAFDELFVNMIAAGEAGGILDTILKRLATYIEKAVKLKGQVKGAMVYPIAVISIAGIVIAVIMWKVIPTFASMFDGLGAQPPLPTLVSSGVPILDGLEITARTSGNAIIEDAIMAVRKGVEGGLTIAQPLKDSGVFPPMVVQMIGVGEQTGALDAMLSKIADFYEEEVDQAVANLLTLMEPVMILFLGTTVGGIVIAMYLP